MKRALALVLAFVSLTAAAPRTARTPSARLGIFPGIWRLDIVQSDSVRPYIDKDTICVDMSQVQPDWVAGQLWVPTSIFNLSDTAVVRVKIARSMSEGCTNRETSLDNIGAINAMQVLGFDDPNGLIAHYWMIVVWSELDSAGVWNDTNTYRRPYHLSIQAGTH